MKPVHPSCPGSTHYEHVGGRCVCAALWDVHNRATLRAVIYLSAAMLAGIVWGYLVQL